MLSDYIGPDAFRKGLFIYLNKFKYGNATTKGIHLVPFPRPQPRITDLPDPSDTLPLMHPFPLTPSLTKPYPNSNSKPNPNPNLTEPESLTLTSTTFRAAYF